MWTIKWDKKAEKKFDKLENQIQRRIQTFLNERLIYNPEYHSTQLVGVNYFRARVGDYRIIFELQDDKVVILVLDLGHRKEVYQDL